MKLENDLRSDPIRPLVLRIAIPSMLAQFVSVLYSVVDRMYIGNIAQVGSLALAGAGVCGPIVTMLGSVAFWVGVGGSPLISIRMGEGRQEEARRVLANCFLLLTCLALALTGLAYATRRPALLLFGASPETLPYAMDYYSYYLTGTVFALLSTGMNQFIICQGFAKKGMQSVMLGAVLNIILDPVFIFLLDLGVKGAAIATVLSQLASCLFVLRFLFGPIPPVRITFGGYSLRTMLRILLTGLTPFVIIAVDNMMIIALNAVLQRYGGPEQGDLLVAAATVAQSFMLVVTMPLDGIAAGTASILGYNLGAGQPKRILEAQNPLPGLYHHPVPGRVAAGRPLHPHFHAGSPGLRPGGDRHPHLLHRRGPAGGAVRHCGRTERHGDDAVLPPPVLLPEGCLFCGPVCPACRLRRGVHLLRRDHLRPDPPSGHRAVLPAEAGLDPGAGPEPPRGPERKNRLHDVLNRDGRNGGFLE